jgi:hypothetical protein
MDIYIYIYIYIYVDGTKDNSLLLFHVDPFNIRLVSLQAKWLIDMCVREIRSRTLQNVTLYLHCLSCYIVLCETAVSSRPNQRKDWCLFMKECREARHSKYFETRATYLEIPGARYLYCTPAMKNVTFLLQNIKHTLSSMPFD